MKKIFLIIITLALITSSCNISTKEQSVNEIITMPSQSYLGTWHTADNPPNDLTILEIDDNTIKFELGIFRKVLAEGTAKIENGKIIFDTYSGFSGTLKFSGDTILVMIDEAGDKSIIKVGTVYKFTVKVKGKQPQPKLKHCYADDGQVHGKFFDDGTCLVHDNTMPDQLRATYKEYPSLLMANIGQRKWQLFNDWGHIIRGWQVVNYYHIYSYLQITNFEDETAKIPAKDIQNINKTCLIFITPEQSADPDEDYDPVIEWQNYAYDRKEEYEAKGIKSVDAEKRYLSFTLYDGEKIVVDTKKKQNGTIYSALLYRKGYIPIIISISGESEEGKEMIEWYFGESGDGNLPFKRWNILKE